MVRDQEGAAFFIASRVSRGTRYPQAPAGTVCRAEWAAPPHPTRPFNRSNTQSRADLYRCGQPGEPRRAAAPMSRLSIMANRYVKLRPEPGQQPHPGQGGQHSAALGRPTSPSPMLSATWNDLM
jgi:hypothetical protein